VIAAGLLLDTGPLVAMLDPRQEGYQACRAVYEKWNEPFITTEAVITEATHLLNRLPGGSITCLEFIRDRKMAVMPISGEALTKVITLMKKYHDIPMDYADATLVTLAEELETNQIFTLDRRGFSAYRMHGRTPFHILPN